MSMKDIPDECINDPQFVQILTATLVSENIANEKLLKNFATEIKLLKVSVAKKIQERKDVKQKLRENKEKKLFMEPLLEYLTGNECERKTQLTLLKNRLDEGSLRKKITHTEYRRIIEAYKETWNNYKTEYEEFEYAILRKQSKIECEKLKIQCMIKQYKHSEYRNMIRQKEMIDRKRTQATIIRISKLMLNRFQNQDYLDILYNKIKKAEWGLEIITQEYEKMKENLETEAKKKALAKQLMPLPKLNISLVQSFYVDRRTPQCQVVRNHKFCPKQTVDLDTVSINTIMFEELCNNEESMESTTPCQNYAHKETENENLSPSIQQVENSQFISNDANNSMAESAIETLENHCSQLSITNETCDNQNHEIPKIKPMIEFHLESQSRQEEYCDDNIYSLKHKLSNEGSDASESGEPKKSKLTELSKLSPTPPPPSSSLLLVTQNNPCDESNSIVNNCQSEKESLTAASATDTLPQIKKIEIITRPVTIQVKPPMAEVPPTPSSLFSPRHYAPSYASSANLSHFVDNNCNDLAQDIGDLDNFSETWGNLSPPQAGSEISFASSHIPADNIIPNKNVPNFISQPEKPTSNYLNFFTAGSMNPKSLF